MVLDLELEGANQRIILYKGLFLARAHTHEKQPINYDYYSHPP
jgi:hypothetical protein